MRRLLLLSLAIMLEFSWLEVEPCVAELTINRLHHSPPDFDPNRGASVDFLFSITEPASVVLRIFDGRDWLVRKIEPEGELPVGAHELQWDGRDEAGEFVPPEAYHYTLQALAKNGARVRYDMTDRTGNRRLRVTEVSWIPEDGVVRYLVPDDARVTVRIGIAKGGPLLLALRDWVPRRAGWHDETWDGFDASRTLNVAGLPDLDVTVYAASLPDNTIFVLPRPIASSLVDASTWPREVRESGRQRRKRARIPVVGKLALQQQAVLQLSLPLDLPQTPEGLPIVSGVVPVRLDVAPEDKARVETERFETTFFLDWKYQFENETGFLPATWLWDTNEVSRGEHILTGNFLGYGAKHGSATVRVFVEPEDPAERPTRAKGELDVGNGVLR